MAKRKESEKKLNIENNRGMQIDNGFLFIPILIKMRISKVVRIIILSLTVFGTAYFVDFQSPIYAILLTVLMEVSAIIFD